MKATAARIITAIVAALLLILFMWGLVDYAQHCTTHTSSRLEDPQCK